MGGSLIERDDVLMKVKLKFKSPFIVGGIKRVSNYIETLDYIPGNVLRAAFSICEHIYDLAKMSHKQLEPDDMTKFIERSNSLLTKLASGL